LYAIPVKQLLRLASVLALAVGALVAFTPGQASAAGVACQKTFSNFTDFAIPDSGNANSLIDVDEDNLVVSDLNVSFNIDHTYDDDLEIWLYHYTDIGDFVSQTRLVNGDGGSGDNFTNTVLDDEASTPISWGVAPFSGRYLPNQRLSAFDGDSNGKYYFYAFDNAGGDTGTIKDVTLTFRYKSCDFDSDGVEDHSDQCLQLSAHTATGCPVTSRSVTAKYKNGKFRGALSSPVHGCEAGRPVTIYKVRAGADKKIGTATSRSDGTYRLTRAKHAGRYYATSPRVAVVDVAECPAVKSATFKIH
jgi:subtilisin-like proprotein convertase family protein